MKEIGATESEAYLALVRSLRSTGIQAIPDARGDHDFLLRWNDRSAAIQVKSAGQGWPADVQRLLRQYRSHAKRNIVFFAPNFSATARQALTEHSSNWLDASALHLRLPGKLLIHVERDVDAEATSRRFSWSPSAYEIAEYVLATRPRRLKLADIAAATGRSKPMVSKTFVQWDLMGWTAKRGSPRGAGAWRELVSPGGLLEAWSAERSSPARQGTVIHAHAVVRDATSFALGPLAAALKLAPEYAFTSWIAASQLTPFSTIVPTLHVYVPTSMIDSGAYEAILDQAGLKEVEESGFVTLEAATPAVFRSSSREPIPIASKPRIYADLLRGGGRSTEVAQHFREASIGF